MMQSSKDGVLDVNKVKTELKEVLSTSMFRGPFFVGSDVGVYLVTARARLISNSYTGDRLESRCKLVSQHYFFPIGLLLGHLVDSTLAFELTKRCHV